MRVWSEQERAEIIKRVDRALPAYEAATPRCEGRRALWIVPLSLAALGALGTCLMTEWGVPRPGLPISPMILTAIVARAISLRAARATAALIVPAVLYSVWWAWDWDLGELVWGAVHLGSLAALCVNVSWFSGSGRTSSLGGPGKGYRTVAAAE